MSGIAAVGSDAGNAVGSTSGKVFGVVVRDVFLLFAGRGGEMSLARLDGRFIATIIDPEGLVKFQFVLNVLVLKHDSRCLIVG
jgi:hypothetical protein